MLILLSFDRAKKAIERPSGDQNGHVAPSVPIRGLGSRVSRARIQSAYPEHQSSIAGSGERQLASVGKNSERFEATVFRRKNGKPQDGGSTCRCRRSQLQKFRHISAFGNEIRTESARPSSS